MSNEPTPTPTPTPTPAPAPAPNPAVNATLDSPLGFENSQGWTTVGDIVNANNKLRGQLANPTAPEQYSLDAVNEFYRNNSPDPNNPLTVDVENGEFRALVGALRTGGLSQAAFDKVVTAYIAGVDTVDAESHKARMTDAMTKIGGEDALKTVFGAADKAGIGALARKASGDEMVALNRMLNAVSQVGGLNPPNPANPAPAPSGDASKYHAECQTTINGQTIGIDPSDYNSFVEFKKFVVGADADGKGGRPFYKTPAGQTIYAKAQQIRAQLARDPANNIKFGQGAQPAAA